MKTKIVSLFSVMMFFLFIITVCLIGINHPVIASEVQVTPQSLEQYYPPKAPAPVYLFNMLQLSGNFSGIASDLMEGDFENAQTNFNAFKEEYSGTSKMIPEWASYFSMEAVDQLETALKTGDPGKVMPAYSKVGETCNNCHNETMADVYFKFHWSDFSSISETDPISNEKVPFSRLMQLVESDLNGIMNDLTQGQTENAAAHVNQLERRYKALEETCYTCHDSERKYFVGDDVNTTFASLRDAMNQAEVDVDGIGGLVQSIGMESCYKCHLVHVPASMTRKKMIVQQK